MSILEILIIGLALSMDAFAVTLSNACAYPHATKAQRLAMPVIFGLLQGIMPLIGYFAGSFITEILNAYSGIIALVILGIIGGRMVWGGIKDMLKHHKTDETEIKSVEETPRQLTFPLLLLQGIATSIDALIIGVSFLALGANIFVAAPLVTLTTFLCCVVALVLGRRFGVLLGDKAEIAGGLVLILIGIKTLF